MKRYKFTMKDKYDGSVMDGHADGLTWQEAWTKLSPLLKGHTILDIEDVDEVAEEEKPSNMNILQLVKKEDPLVEDVEYKKLSLMLISGDQISVLANETLLGQVDAWFHDPEEMPPTISLSVDKTLINIDRMFVGAIFVSPITEEDEEDDNVKSTEGESTVEGGTPNGNL